jgi:membrane protease subunit (stomatin/prohibitin family)
MPGLLRMAGRTAVVAGTATAVSGRVARRQQGRWADQEQQQFEQQQQAAAAAPAQTAPQQDDPMAKLKELGQLHESGVLTDDEFAAAKAKLLGI